MDYTKLSNVVTEITDSSKKVDKKEVSKVVDSEKFARRKAVRDAVRRIREKKEEETKVADSKKYAEFKVTDGYKNILKKVKDELGETETTEEAIEVVINNLQDAPAEQVLSAVVEVLGEAIDILQGEDEVVEDVDESVVETEEPSEEVDESIEESVEESLEDSAKEKCLVETVSEFYKDGSKESKSWKPSDLNKKEFDEEEIEKAKEALKGMDKDNLLESVEGTKDEFTVKFK